MDGFTLSERLKTIFETIISSSFFITLLVILVFTITILIINAKVKSKAPKIIAIVSYILLMILVLARYGGYVLAINDSVVDKFFKAMYFPNLVVYLSMLLISLLLLALNFVDTHYTQITKLFNIICFALIWFFFVLVLDSAKSYGINIYEITDIYSNSTMMILLQASMCVFFIWLGILIMNFVVRKLTYKLDNKPKSNEYNMNDNYSYDESNNYQDYNLNEQNNSYNNQSYEMNNYQNSNNYVDSSNINTNNTINNNFNNDSYQGINNYNNTNNTYNNVSNSYGNYSNTNYQNSDYNNNYGQNNNYQNNNAYGNVNYNNIDNKINSKKSIVNIFKRNKNKDNDDEIVQFSDEDFKNSYLNIQKYDKNDEINQIMDNKHLDS